MSNHTPGPWALDEDSYTIESGGLIIASVCTVDDYSGAEEEYKPQLAKECAANATLIAAAPDLYEALAVLHTLLDFDDEVAAGVGIVTENPDRINHAFKVARAALRKARGEA